MRAIRRYSALSAVFFGFFALSQCVASEAQSGRVIDAGTALADQPGAPSRIPAAAKSGTVAAVGGAYLMVDGQPLQMAPGGWIRGRTNLIVMPGSIQPGSRIFYQTDRQGQLEKGWLPTDEESEKRPDRNWSFSLGTVKP